MSNSATDFTTTSVTASPGETGGFAISSAAAVAEMLTNAKLRETRERYKHDRFRAMYELPHPEWQGVKPGYVKKS